MILRRFIQHFKEQHWFAVGLDIIVVIVGIFIGMQVTEWNEERKGKFILDQYLNNLATEFANSKEMYGNHVEWQSLQIKTLKLALKVLDGHDVSEEAMASIYRTLSMPMMPPPDPGKREILFEMQNTGLLQQIPFGELKSALTEILSTRRQSHEFIEMSNSLLTAPDFSFESVSWALVDEEKSKGLLIISNIDWLVARSDKNFRKRILQMYAAYSFSIDNKRLAMGLDNEALRLLAEQGYTPGENWLTKYLQRENPDLIKDRTGEFRE